MVKKIFILFLLLLISCSKSDDFEVHGRVLFEGKPIYDCEISIFIKEEKDKTIPPIKVVATDENGIFSVKLKKGTYYFNARKRHTIDGETVMLVGDTKKIEVLNNVNIGDWTLYSKKDSKTYAKGTGIEGKVINFTDFSKVRIYIYNNQKTQLRGPDYIKEGKINSDGTFKVDLPEGKFYIAVREREKSLAGPLSKNDKSAIYEKNPVNITKGSYINLGTIKLSNVDINKLQDVTEKGIIKDGIILTGNVYMRDKKIAKKIYILAYENQEMIGKPISVTITDEKGSFRLILPHEGKFYIGARSRLGGPVEPGEYIGSYMGSSDKSIIVKRGKETKINIEVNEVW
jgi:hypothetical protein